MSRKMLINATHPEEHRVAIVEDGYLTELDIETTAKEQTRGNIYKAAVIRVESGLQAAFVDYGGERLGFLQISEIHPNLYPPSPGDDRRGRPRINDILRSGQEILVQVTKEERGTKGAALTTYVSLAGRYMVLMPESPTKGVSRKIEEESERKKLKKSMAELDLPENMGYIVRTAGIGKAPEELRRDFENLVEIHRGIQERAHQAKAPCLIFRESNLIIRCIRDYFTEETEEVLIDDPVMHEAARDFFRMLMPDKVKLVKLHQERRPIFSRYQIEEQIETINHNKVNLPSGGSIVLDTTEALVAVDVNSGKMSSEQGIEATAYKTNLEAAEEIARQLRLRDLAGLIVIDFIDMRDRKNIRAIEKKMRDALKKDKSRVTVGRISQFGLLEMSRQRLKPNLSAASYRVCPQCQGHGQIKSVETQGLAFLRRIQAASAAKGQLHRIEGRLPLEVADYLLNIKREEISEMERRYDMEIILHGQSGLLPQEAELNTLRREKEETSSDDGDIAPIDLVSQVDSVLNGSSEKETNLSAKENEAAPTEANAAAAENEPVEQAPKKRRRRRRRKKTPASEATGTEAAQGAMEPAQVENKEKEPSVGKEGDSSSDQPVTSPATPAVKKSETPSVTGAPLPQGTLQGEEAAQPEMTAEKKEEPQTAPSRARAPRRRKSTRIKAAESPSAPTAAAVEDPAADQAASKSPKKKEETPGEPAAAEAGQEQQTKPQEAPAPEADPSALEAQAAAPRKRRGRPRKTEAKKEQENEKAEAPAATSPPQQGAAQGEAKEIEAMPAPRRRTTRKASTSSRATTRKSPEKTEKPAESAEETEKVTSGAEAEEKKAAAPKKATTTRARRTTTTRKTPARPKATEKSAEAEGEPESTPGKDASAKASPTKKSSVTGKSAAAKKTPAKPRTRRTAARTTKTDKSSQSESSPDEDRENSDQ